jgi:hypothetical protein
MISYAIPPNDSKNVCGENFLKGCTSVSTIEFLAKSIPMGVSRHKDEALLSVINRNGDTVGSISAKILISSRFEAKKATAMSMTDEATNGLNF